MMLRDFVCETDLAIKDRNPQRRRTERLCRRFQIVTLLRIAPHHHELAAPSDVA